MQLKVLFGIIIQLLFSYSDRLISPELNFSNTSANHTLKFDLAYQQRSVSSQLKDTLRVYLSNNCGDSFDYLVYEKYAEDLSTHDTVSYDFIPLYAHHWRTDSVDLSNFSGQTVLLKFETSNRQGNNLYLDNIYIYDGEDQPVQTYSIENSMTIYPNPTKNLIVIDLSIPLTPGSFVSIYNNLGQFILKKNIDQNQTHIPLNMIDKGFYYLKFNDQHNVFTKTFIVW